MLTFDATSTPYTLMQWRGRPTDDDVATLIGALEWEAAQAEPVYAFADLRGSAFPEARVLRAIALAFKRYENARRVRLLVLIVDDLIIRSALNAIRWISRPPAPEIFVRDGRAAIERGEAQARALGAPPISDALREQLLRSDDEPDDDGPNGDAGTPRVDA